MVFRGWKKAKSSEPHELKYSKFLLFIGQSRQIINEHKQGIAKHNQLVVRSDGKLGKYAAMVLGSTIIVEATSISLVKACQFRSAGIQMAG